VLKIRFAVVLAVLAALVLAVVSSAPAQPQNAEQVVFSGTGFGSQGPFGFWIWCMAEPSGQSAGVYEDECAGSMYFYALGITRGVSGDVTETSEGVYQMDVSSRRDDAVSCVLWNETPIQHGPRNTVHASCSSPASVGTSTNAVVNVTGP
jgi:hypothetical protein